MGAVAGGESSGPGRAAPSAFSAFQVACVYSDIDTTKVDVGAFASRIVAAQQTIPVHQTKTVHRIMDAHDCYVRVLVWDPFRDLLVSGGGDGWIRLWRTSDYSYVDELSAKLSVRAMSVLTSELVSGHSNGEVHIWDMNDPNRPCTQQIRAHEEAVYAISVLRSGELVTGAEDIRVFAKGMWGYSHMLTISEEVLCMVAIPGSSSVVTGNMNSLILVWDSAENWKVEAECKGHKRSVWTLTYVRDIARIASGSADHSIRIWNPANWECERALTDHTGWVVGLSCAPGMMLSCSIDQGIRVWNVKDWNCEREFKDHDYEVYAICSFAGGRFCTGGAEMAIMIYGGPEHDNPVRGSGGTAFPGVKPSSSGRPGSGKDLRRPPAEPCRTSTPPRSALSPRSQAKNLPSTWGTAHAVEPPPSSGGYDWMSLPEWVAAPLASVTGGAITPRSAARASEAQRAQPQQDARQRSKSPQQVRFADKPEELHPGQPVPARSAPASQPQLSAPQSRRRELTAGLSDLDFTMSDFREHLVEVEKTAKKRSNSRERREVTSPSAAAPPAGYASAPAPASRGRGGLPSSIIGTSDFGSGSSPRSGRAPSPKPSAKFGDLSESPGAFDDMLFETVKAVPSARDLGLEPIAVTAKPVGEEGVTDWTAALLAKGRT